MYLGDSAHLKYLVPEPSAAIYISDFQNISTLVEYLTYLTTNETAYEEHRSWRSRFTFERNVRNKPILKTSWFCRVCQWAGLVICYLCMLWALISIHCCYDISGSRPNYPEET